METPLTNHWFTVAIVQAQRQIPSQGGRQGESRGDASLVGSQVISSETVLIKENRRFRQVGGSPSYVLAVTKETIGLENVNPSGM